MLFNPDMVLKTQDEIVKIAQNEYEAGEAEAWGDLVVAERTGKGRKELLTWYLQTARIEKIIPGEQIFDELMSVAFEVVHEKYGAGLRLTEEQFEDDDLEGSAVWSTGVGQYMRFLNQIEAAKLMIAGKTQNGWDGTPFFGTTHPVHPGDASLGTYGNLRTAFPLTPANLATVVGQMETYKLPNGDYRRLRVTHLFHDPSIRKLAKEAVSARVVLGVGGASQAGGVENVVADYGIVPVSCHELSSEPGVWYVAAKEAGSLGKPILCQIRTEFKMTDYTGVNQSQLNKDQAVEWTLKGRRAYAYGNPFQMVRCEPT